MSKDPTTMLEHRKHPRFRLLHTTARTTAFEAPVLDLSLSGMRIEPPLRLSAGTALDFDVSDRNHHLDVAGRVRWSRRSAGSDDGRAYRAGVQFVRILTDDAKGVWARLIAESGETGLPVGHRPAASEAASRVPLLTILSPEDGTVTRHGAVTVIGQVRDPGLGAMIEVNGIRALVYGRRFEARIPLIEGANLVSATVSTSMAPVCRSLAVRVICACHPAGAH
jgi:hypothetical protein